MLRRIVIKRSIIPTRAKGSSTSLDAQLGQAWTNSRLLAPAARAVALQSRSKAKLLRLQSLERLIATALWENEWEYAYVAARELIDRYPCEVEQGGSNMDK